MTRAAAITRTLMVLLCLVPFTSVRQASGGLAPPAPAGETPAPAPVEEEDDQRESADGRERHAAHTRPAACHFSTLPLTRNVRPSPVTSTSSPRDPDPFHNGLGTHYRC